MAVLDELSSAITDVAERVGPAVVGLGRGWGRGTGVVIAPDLVLTNAHNLRGEEVTVVAGGKPLPGTVAGVDPDGDIAVIRADLGDVEPIAWAESADERAIGTPVFALADPGGRGLRVTLGFVASSGRSFRGPRGRRVRGAIEHTAPLPRGSSGGPLVNAAGELIGINTVRLDGGLILALPTDASLKERVDALSRGESTGTPRLGIALAPPHLSRRLRRSVGLPDRDGLLVRGVEEGGPADRAGIERGDLVIAADGSPIARIDDIHAALDGAEDGRLKLTLLRGTDEREAAVEFAAEATR
jgi:serine protease Do